MSAQDGNRPVAAPGPLGLLGIPRREGGLHRLWDARLPGGSSAATFLCSRPPAGASIPGNQVGPAVWREAAVGRTAAEAFLGA